MAAVRKKMAKEELLAPEVAAAAAAV
ncbi:hypothetical protein PMI14_02835, partial [Acidovorax sp. CF316]